MKIKLNKIESAMDIINILNKKFDSYEGQTHEAINLLQNLSNDPISADINGLNGYQLLIDDMYHVLIPISQLEGIVISPIMHSLNRGRVEYIDSKKLGRCLLVPLNIKNKSNNIESDMQKINCGINIETIVVPSGNKCTFGCTWMCNYAYISD